MPIRMDAPGCLIVQNSKMLEKEEETVSQFNTNLKIMVRLRPSAKHLVTWMVLVILSRLAKNKDRINEVEL